MHTRYGPPGRAGGARPRAGENFSVASLVLGRRATRPPARDLRLRPARRPARRRRRRRPPRAARPARGRARPRLRRRAGASAAAAARADGARARPAARAVPAPDRGEPAGPARRAYATYEELLGYCELSANPVGELVLHVFGAATPSGSRSRTASAPRCSSPSTGRTSARTAGNGASTCPREDWTASASTTDELAAPRDADAACAAARVRGRARASAARRGRAARRRAARPRAARGRRLRRRRARGARRDRRGRTTTCSAARRGAGAPGACAQTLREPARTAGERRPRARLRALPARRARVGLELLHRHAAAAAATGATRSSRSTRSRGGSTTSPTATSPPTRSSPSSTRIARRARAASSGADDPVLVAVADAARRFPIPLDAFGDLVDGAEMDVRGRDVRDLRRARALLPPRRRARSAGSRSASSDCSDRARAERAGRRPRRRAAARQHPARRRARTSRNGRVYLPREDLERFGCDVATALDGPGRAARCVRGAARARLARARPRRSCRCSTAAARPACSPWPACTGACSTRIAARAGDSSCAARLSLRPLGEGLGRSRAASRGGAA